MGSLKSKLRCLKTKKPAAGGGLYDRIEKSESMRVEIRSRKAQKLIQETLKAAKLGKDILNRSTNKRRRQLEYR
ncbi:hypothetical protein ACET3Z_011174 [Daucus carota]